MSNYNNNQGNQQNSFPNFFQVQLVGYIAQDPESKVIGDGVKVATASIPVTQNDGGTEWWQIEAWANGENAKVHNFLKDHCKKGRQVLVVGRPIVKTGQKQDGTMGVYRTIRASQIIGLGSSNGSKQQSNQVQSPTGSNQNYGAPNYNQNHWNFNNNASQDPFQPYNNQVNTPFGAPNMPPSHQNSAPSAGVANMGPSYTPSVHAPGSEGPAPVMSNGYPGN